MREIIKYIKQQNSQIQNKVMLRLERRGGGECIIEVVDWIEGEVGDV